jgi:hypothetical protein
MRQTMILSRDDRTEVQTGAIRVATPLDAIARLEHQHRISTVVLAGSFADDRELAESLAELYPSIQVEVAI